MPTFKPYTRRQLDRMLIYLRDAIYTPVSDLEITAWRTTEPVSFQERFSGEELHLKPGDKWGKLFDCAWFRFAGTVPSQAANKPVVLLLDVNGEMCVVDQVGNPLRGLTTVSSDYDYSLGTPGKRVFPLCNYASSSERFEIWADAGCNDLFGNLQRNGEIREASIAILNETMRDLFYDVEVLLDALKVLPEETARHQQILTALNDVEHLLMGEQSENTDWQVRRILSPILAKRGGDPSLQISAIGHAHIDLAWLWPLRETKRKGQRTFSTALANMDIYPDYRFAASQAQLFAWMKESDPVLYGRIKDAVAAGKLEPQGALWVECDTNVTSGESLVRQILYGRRYFQQEFGVDVPYVWLPDTFGYSGALPQIMQKAGMKYFSTQKLSWSLINTFPHQTFHWEGIDGSRILVHMLSEETYNSSAAPRTLGKIEANYRDKGVSQHALLVFGIGDGGGGPGEEHLERLDRLKNFAGLCPVRQEWTIDFFHKLEKEADRFATWAGELYLERHEGTLTTHARNKRYNRLMEQGLRDLEWLSLLAENIDGIPYPAEPLNRIWRETLLYQFHDILPGSSIKRVYDETTPRYQAMLAEVQEFSSAAANTLAQKVDTAAMAKPFVLFNTLPWQRTEWIRLGEAWQPVTVPPMGYCAVDSASPAAVPAVPCAKPDCLENDRLTVHFGEDGAITSIYDKRADREVLPAVTKANQFAVYRDLGDAWDFPMDYAESLPRRMQLLSATAHTDGPRAVLVQEYRLGTSTLTQEISLTAGSACLEFSTRASWREIQSMLRVSFPLAIHAAGAACDIQFGHIQRTTHRNTTWDMARDEIAAQKWVDISQGDYGVALLNDCKYGHKVKDNILDLNLLRSAPYPGPRLIKDEQVAAGEPHDGYTDQTDHTFRYALYPHAGSLLDGGVIPAAYAFNIPLRAVPVAASAGALPTAKSFLQLDSDKIVIEAVKKAEEGDGWIARMYESSGSQVRAKLQINLPVQSAQEVDLMEVPLGDLAIQGNSLNLVFQPFEIKSVKLA